MGGYWPGDCLGALLMDTWAAAWEYDAGVEV